RWLDQLGLRLRTDRGFRRRDLGLGRRIGLGLSSIRRLDLRTLGIGSLGIGSLGIGSLGIGSLRQRVRCRDGCEQGGTEQSVESIGHGESLTLYQGPGKAVVWSKWREKRPPMRDTNASALACLEPALHLVDHIDPALAPHQAVGPMATAQRFQ